MRYPTSAIASPSLINHSFLQSRNLQRNLIRSFSPPPLQNRLVSNCSSISRSFRPLKKPFLSGYHSLPDGRNAASSGKGGGRGEGRLLGRVRNIIIIIGTSVYIYFGCSSDYNTLASPPPIFFSLFTDIYNEATNELRKPSSSTTPFRQTIQPPAPKFANGNSSPSASGRKIQQKSFLWGKTLALFIFATRIRLDTYGKKLERAYLNPGV